MARPDGVPEKATQLEDGTWVLGNVVAGKHHGQFRFYDATGNETKIVHYDRGAITKLFVYHKEGSGSLDFIKKVGKVVRYKSADLAVTHFGEGLPTFPSPETSEVTFELDVSDIERGVYEIKNPVYRDRFGGQLSANGTLASKPTPTAVMVQSADERFWRDGAPASGERHGVWTYYAVNGPKSFELCYENGNLASLSAFDEGGALVLEQVFGSKISIVEGHQRFELERASGKCTLRVQKTRKSKPKETIVELGPIATPAEFMQKFESLYAPVLKLASVTVNAGNFKITHASFERYDDVLRISSLLGNGGGDELVVIEEPGKHKGRVFCNRHDEGLYSIESIDEFIGQELVSRIRETEKVDAVVANKERLIECLPFFENPIAKDLGELLAKIDVVPATDHRTRLEVLAPAT